MDYRPSYKGKKLIFRVDIKNGRKDAAGDHIVRSGQAHKQNLSVSRLRYKNPGKLGNKNLENGYPKVAYITVRKQIQFQAIRYSQYEKRKNTDQHCFSFRIAVRHK